MALVIKTINLFDINNSNINDKIVCTVVSIYEKVCLALMKFM